MKKQINQIQQYFKNKILTGDYEAEFQDLKDQTSIQLTIDKEYKFCFWTANGSSHFDQVLVPCSFMILPKFDHKEKNRAFDLLKPIIKDLKEKTVYRNKLEIYNNLKVELTKLGLLPLKK